MRYCIALGEEMGKFLYRSINKLSSGKIRVKYTTNPTDAKNFGGILTCRLVEYINPISNIKIGLKGSPSTILPPTKYRGASPSRIPSRPF